MADNCPYDHGEVVIAPLVSSASTQQPSGSNAVSGGDEISGGYGMTGGASVIGQPPTGSIGSGVSNTNMYGLPVSGGPGLAGAAPQPYVPMSAVNSSEMYQQQRQQRMNQMNMMNQRRGGGVGGGLHMQMGTPQQQQFANKQQGIQQKFD